MECDVINTESKTSKEEKMILKQEGKISFYTNCKDTTKTTSTNQYFDRVHRLKKYNI